MALSVSRLALAASANPATARGGTAAYFSFTPAPLTASSPIGATAGQLSAGAPTA